MAVTGEELFERFCAALRLKNQRIAESVKEGEQRPDFYVTGSDGTEFLAEVKLVTPTEEEARNIARFDAGEIFATGGTPDERMRRWIGKANRQLKALGTGTPAVLVVFNPTFLLGRHTDPYSILTAMRGLDTVDIHVPADPHKQPVFGGLRSGGAKKMTATDNTSTSAVICPQEVAGVWRAMVYHNRFAAFPLPPTAIQGEHVVQLRISDDERDWVPLPAGVK